MKIAFCNFNQTVCVIRIRTEVFRVKVRRADHEAITTNLLNMLKDYPGFDFNKNHN